MVIALAGYDYADNQALFVCRHVIEGKEVLLFVNDHEGDLQFTCGADGHELEDIKVVCIAEAVEMLPDDDLPIVAPGHAAERRNGTDEWKVSDVPREN